MGSNRKLCVLCMTRHSRSAVTRVETTKPDNPVYVCKTCADAMFMRHQSMHACFQGYEDGQRRKGFGRKRSKIDRWRRTNSYKADHAFFKRYHTAFQQGRCAHCGANFDDDLRPTLDHVVPLSHGGLHTLDNTQVICRPCHDIKDREDLEKYKPDDE